MNLDIALAWIDPGADYTIVRDQDGRRLLTGWRSDVSPERPTPQQILEAEAQAIAAGALADWEEFGDALRRSPHILTVIQSFYGFPDLAAMFNLITVDVAIAALKGTDRQFLERFSDSFRALQLSAKTREIYFVHQNRQAWNDLVRRARLPVAMLLEESA